MYNKHTRSGNFAESNLGRRPNGDAVPEFDDDNRIDWDRKQRSKRREDSPVDLTASLIDDALDDLEDFSGKKKIRKDRRQKRRQYIYDEELGHVVVKHRRRKGRSEFSGFEDQWD